MKYAAKKKNFNSDKLNTLSKLKKTGFEGVADINLEISLFEYGIIVKQDKRMKKDEFLFIFGLPEFYKNEEFTNFIIWEYDPDVINDFVDNAKDFVGMLNYNGISQNDWQQLSIPQKISDIVGYQGLTDTIGESYWSFPINRDGRANIITDSYKYV